MFNNVKVMIVMKYPSTHIYMYKCIPCIYTCDYSNCTVKGIKVEFWTGLSRFRTGDQCYLTIMASVIATGSGSVQ